MNAPSSLTTFDPELLRRDFPLLDQEVQVTRWSISITPPLRRNRGR